MVEIVKNEESVDLVKEDFEKEFKSLKESIKHPNSVDGNENEKKVQNNIMREKLMETSKEFVLAVNSVEKDKDFNELMKEVPNSIKLVKKTKQLVEFSKGEGLKELPIEDLNSLVKSGVETFQTLLLGCANTEGFKEGTLKGAVVDAQYGKFIEDGYNPVINDKGYADFNKLEKDSSEILKKYESVYGD